MLLPAALLGTAVALLLRRSPVFDLASARVSTVAAQEIERELEVHRGIERMVRKRLHPRLATGLLLTAALALLVLGGLVVGILGLLVREHGSIVSLDHSVAPWGLMHADHFARSTLDFVTKFGGSTYLYPIMIGVAIFEMMRRPSWWLPPFLAAVGLGQAITSDSIKDLVDRVRPTINPVASALGPAFPSGHATGAAACFAAVALLLGRGRSRVTQAALAGGAVFIAVTVAASRVLLGVHWLTDVVGGLALGLAWFALCSIAFGGRLLEFGLPVEAADRVVASHGRESLPARRPHAS